MAHYFIVCVRVCIHVFFFKFKYYNLLMIFMYQTVKSNGYKKQIRFTQCHVNTNESKK